MEDVVLLVVFMSFNEAMFRDGLQKLLFSSLFKAILNLSISIEEALIAGKRQNEVKSLKQSLDHVLSALMCFYNRAEENDQLNIVKIEENDLFVIQYLVKLLEHCQDNEDIIQLIFQVLLIPVIFALHPENHALNPQQFLKTIHELNISYYEFKIATVAKKF